MLENTGEKATYTESYMYNPGLVCTHTDFTVQVLVPSTIAAYSTYQAYMWKHKCHCVAVLKTFIRDTRLIIAKKQANAAESEQNRIGGNYRTVWELTKYLVKHELLFWHIYDYWLTKMYQRFRNT